MTRAELQSIINAITTIRASATDEQALQAVALYPAWRAGTDYAVDDRIRYDGTLYRVIQAHTSQETWTPDAAASLFAEVLIPDPEVIPEWVQPDSTNPYMTGDRVRYGGKTWESTIDNNVWTPGEYGWNEVLISA